jgi:hypothetical protein
MIKNLRRPTVGTAAYPTAITTLGPAHITAASLVGIRGTNDRALRCHAKSKRSGLRCQAPAVRGRSVCRMHGAGGGAPNGNQNAFKHGELTAEGLALKRQISALARMARETIRTLEGDAGTT